ncbi:MAG: DUF1788 domain-containing protein [Magnetococcales bacterium]|nr:DUF1788 domain-containing protein [Magnetococcales bacterium]
MSRIKRLADSYGRHIAVPWREDAAAAQRVIFCVYHQTDERALRAGIGEFDIVTRRAGHGWILFDLTDTFAEWLAGQRYAVKYFQQPRLLSSLLPRYQEFIVARCKAFLADCQAGATDVVAFQGVGSLFGLLRVKPLVDQLAPLVPGRLVLFFPGSCEHDNYRLLDGYDGWNYLAMCITADKDG